MRNAGGEAFVSRGTVHTVIGLVGDTARFQVIPFTQLRGVDHVIQIGKPYKMVSADLHPEPTMVKVGTTPVGRATFTIIAGPCAVESEDQAMRAALAAKAAGATILRGDVYKPRTSPYSFQGLGERGLEILGECRRETGLPMVVEVVDVSHVQHVTEIADCIRVGTRNAQNFELLKEVGLTNKPVMLKRGLAMKRHLVRPMALAAVAAGADAVMIDVHHDPETALCDGPQALLPEEMAALGDDLRRVAEAVGRPVNR